MSIKFLFQGIYCLHDIKDVVGSGVICIFRDERDAVFCALVECIDVGEYKFGVKRYILRELNSVELFSIQNIVSSGGIDTAEIVRNLMVLDSSGEDSSDIEEKPLSQPFSVMTAIDEMYALVDSQVAADVN